MVTSTKDNLQAHRFINRRVRAALLDGNADGERPLSRLGAGTYAGIFVSVALLAVAGIVGVLRPGGSRAWSEPGAFIVESETGGRYVFLDGVLHPVLNYASGKLLLGEQLHVVSVSVRSLESAPHGPPVGIASAPDSVPDAAHMAGSTWSVCAGGDASDGGRFHTAVFPGRAADGSAVPNGQGYLLRGADGGTAWSHMAMPIRSPTGGWPRWATVAPRRSRSRTTSWPHCRLGSPLRRCRLLDWASRGARYPDPPIRSPSALCSSTDSTRTT